MHILGITSGTGFDPAAWARVVDAPLDAFMIREKQLDARPLLEAARWVRARRPDLPLWINGRLDVALAVGAGVHLPEDHPDVPALVLRSRPLHAPEQVRVRWDLDQLLLAPALPVPGKGSGWGREGLQALLAGLPADGPRLLALGGVTPETVRGLRHPRLAGVALLRSLWGAEAPAALLDRLREAWEA